VERLQKPTTFRNRTQAIAPPAIACDHFTQEITMQDIPQSTFTLTITLELTYQPDYLTPEDIGNTIENAIQAAKPIPPTFKPDWEIDDLDWETSDPEPVEFDPLDHPNL
jgi:hypothetical protein